MMSATMPKLRKIRYHRRVALELPAFCDEACFRSEASIRHDLADRSFVQKQSPYAPTPSSLGTRRPSRSPHKPPARCVRQAHRS